MPINRFSYYTGLISVATGSSTVIGVGDAWSGRDREGAQVWVAPEDAAPFRVGTVAAVEPRGVYENHTLPLVYPWNGPDVVSQPFELLDGLAIANGASQAAIYARFNAFMEQNMGLVGNTADNVDTTIVPNNSLFIDSVTRSIYQWRNSVLEQVSVVGLAFTPRGNYSGATTYAMNDLVTSAEGRAFVSNSNGNLNHTPPSTATSNSFWTLLPLPGGGDAFALTIPINRRPLASEWINGHVFVDTVSFPAGLTTSRAYALTEATVDTVFELLRNESQVGTITFEAGETDAAFVMASTQIFTPGDRLDLRAPAVRDDTLENLKITLRGTRSS